MTVAAALAGLLLGGSLAYRAHVNAEERAAIRSQDLQVVRVVCSRLHRLNVAFQGLVSSSVSKDALTKYQYYRDHPEEIKVAQAGAKVTNATLSKADCSPLEIGLTSTSTTGGP